jgi:hypothetical protein
MTAETQKPPVSHHQANLNHKADTLNANPKTSGTNVTRGLNQGNRGKQLMAAKKPQ